MLTTTDGAEAVEGALSITVLPVVLEDTVFDEVVLLTVFEEEVTVLELLLIVLLVVVFVIQQHRLYQPSLHLCRVF